ncbi:hypothetical protein KTR10_02400 [Candidatus Kaiserbacteria bacterium]|nr:hypothetical protein [Candidatus Kaiserbacteria bacterium]
MSKEDTTYKEFVLDAHRVSEYMSRQVYALFSINERGKVVPITFPNSNREVVSLDKALVEELKKLLEGHLCRVEMHALYGLVSMDEKHVFIDDGDNDRLLQRQLTPLFVGGEYEAFLDAYALARSA